MSRGVVEQFTTERRDVLEKKPLGDQQICLDCTICKYQGPREAYIQYIPIRASVLAFFSREGGNWSNEVEELGYFANEMTNGK